jgi:2-phospho-L-lactate guanylyltransferase
VWTDRAIVIPCKALAHGKSRLAPVLAPDERVRLCAQLLRQTLDTAMALVPSSGVWLVTADAEAASLAERCGVAVVADSGDGLNAALEAARCHVFERDDRVQGLLILPIDLPWLDPAALADAMPGGADVVIAADRSGSGTNVLNLSSAAARHLPFNYGEGSFHRHCDVAQRAGHTLRVAANDALAFDLDEPRDWHELNATSAERCLNAAIME